jgi:hypothetical protein
MPRLKKTSLKKNPPTAVSWLHQPWTALALWGMALAIGWNSQTALASRELGWGLIGWGMALLALVGFFWLRRRAPESPSSVLPWRWEAAAVGVAFLGALLVRCIDLGRLPNGFFFDEAMNGLIGLNILTQKGYLPLFGPPDAPIPTLFHYWNALAIWLGGVTVEAARAVPAVLGSLTVVAFYFLARRTHRLEIALAGLVILASMRWHMNFSRINFVGIATPLFGAIAFYFLIRGLETAKAWFWGLSAAAVAGGLYTYYASNLVPMVIAPFWLLYLIWEPQMLQRQWRNVLLFLGVSLFIFSPLAHLALTAPGQFFSRNGQVLIFNHVPPDQALAAFWSNVQKTLLMFNYFGDTNGRHNLPEAPMLDIISGWCLGLGLIWSLTHLHRRWNVLFLLWWLAALVPGFITIEAPQGYRCIGVIVPTAWFVLRGLEVVARGLRLLLETLGLNPWGAWLGLALLVVPLAWKNVQTYFGPQAENAACWSEFSAAEAAMGRMVREAGPRTHTYVSAGSYNYPTLRYLGYPYLDSEPFSPQGSIPSTYAGDKDLLYLLLPVHSAALPVLRFYYPEGKEQIVDTPFDFKLFTRYTVSAQERRLRQGLQAEYRDAQGARLRLAQAEALQSCALADAGLAAPVAAQWGGGMYWPGGGMELRLAGATDARIEFDGKALSTAEQAQGLHRIKIFAQISDLAEPLQLQSRRPNGIWQAVSPTWLNPMPASHGLLGSYFQPIPAQSENSGPALPKNLRPVLRRIDPTLSLLGADFGFSAPFGVRWEGWINIPENGYWIFSLLANQYAALFIDSKTVLTCAKPDQQATGGMYLEAGSHPIRIEYEKREGAYPRLLLTWTPPGAASEPIPFTALSARPVD